MVDFGEQQYALSEWAVLLMVLPLRQGQTLPFTLFDFRMKLFVSLAAASSAGSSKYVLWLTFEYPFTGTSRIPWN